MIEALSRFDKALFLFINQRLGHAWTDPLMLLFSEETVWAIVMLVVIGLSLMKRWKNLRRWLIAAVFAMAMTDLIAFRVLKPYFKRHRPCYQIETVRLVPNSCGGYYSFPSNHAGNSMAVATTVAFFFGWHKFLIIFTIAFLVGFSRIYLGVHYPFDIGLGFLLGASCGALVSFLMIRLYRFKDHRLN